MGVWGELPRCGWEHCDGHLGKFQSCLDEALYIASMDFGNGVTGDVDWGGHYTLLIVGDDPWEIADVGNGATFSIPPGDYIVECVGSGAVYVGTYDTELDARTAFDRIDTAYGEWLDAEGEDSH